MNEKTKEFLGALYIGYRDKTLSEATVNALLKQIGFVLADREEIIKSMKDKIAEEEVDFWQDLLEDECEEDWGAYTVNSCLSNSCIGGGA